MPLNRCESGKRIAADADEQGALAPVIDTHLGPYQLRRRVGVGGMGTVYLAVDARRAGAHRYVAVKCIHPHLCDGREFVDMFLDEADVASRIDHPNVVRVFDFGQLEDAPFLVMEYLSGESVSAIYRALRDGRCPWSVERRAALCARIIADACEALHAAHELRDDHGVPLNVVHRDVSPQNVFVNYEGVVKLVDFGTVRVLGQRHRTRTGFIKGKCAYIAPEILQGGEFDRRADVWSLGVLLWELLTKRRLFMRKHDGATVRAILDHNVTPPSRINPAIPSAYDPIVMAALEERPEDRFASARDLGRALHATLIETHQVVDLGSIAEWMDALFEGGREGHRSMLSQVSAPEYDVDDDVSTYLYCTTDETSKAETPRATLAKPTKRKKRRRRPRTQRASHNWLAAAALLLTSGALMALTWRELQQATAQAAVEPALEAPTPTEPRHSNPSSTTEITRNDDGSMMLEVWSTSDDGARELLWHGSVPETTKEAAEECEARPHWYKSSDRYRYPTGI